MVRCLTRVHPFTGVLIEGHDQNVEWTGKRLTNRLEKLA